MEKVSRWEKASDKIFDWGLLPIDVANRSTTNKAIRALGLLVAFPWFVVYMCIFVIPMFACMMGTFVHDVLNEKVEPK